MDRSCPLDAFRAAAMNFRVPKRRGDDDDRVDAAERDQGFSFVEILMTIVLMGIVLVPLMNATITAVKASSTSRRVAELQTVLLNAADRVNRANVQCSYLVYVQAAAQTKGWPPEQASATYEYYEPGASATVPGTWKVGPTDSPGCSGATPTLNLVQRVTITMKSPESNISRSIQVVKSDV
jgi:prepilin-type N-terminal cleavage/methylation domain-containing protein